MTIKPSLGCATRTDAIMTAHSRVRAAGAPQPRIGYRIADLVEALGVSRRTIERYIANGRLRASHRLGAVIVSAASVNELLGEGERPARHGRRR